MPGVPSLSEELGVDHKTVARAIGLLEHDGLLVNQGPGRPRRIELPEERIESRALRIAVLDFDYISQGEVFMIDLRHRLEAAGHLPFSTDKTLDELGRDVGRVTRYVGRTEADAWIIGAGSREILEWFAEQDRPAFALFGMRDGVPIAATGPDKSPTLVEVTQRLLKLGHRRISFIARHEVRKPKPAPGIRAYLEELEAGGITTGEFNLPSWEESRDGFENLLDSLFRGLTPPTALILDEAFEFNASYHYLSRHGLSIPKDVSLVCTDADPSFEWCQPTVSHIRWDYRPVVRRIVQWANNVARGSDDRRQTLTKAEFVEGGTIGPVSK